MISSDVSLSSEPCIKDVLPLVIDENQLAFLKERGMLESVLMANEVIEEV